MIIHVIFPHLPKGKAKRDCVQIKYFVFNTEKIEMKYFTLPVMQELLQHRKRTVCLFPLKKRESENVKSTNSIVPTK